MDKSGLQVNLDLGQCNIQSGAIVDDLLMPCTTLTIRFESPKKIVFTNDNQCYIRYKDIDWVGNATKSSITNSGLYYYECTLFPRSSSTLVDKPVKNTRELAKAMGLKLSEDSNSLPITIPVKNQYGFEAVKEYRFQSMQNAYIAKDMGQAHILYFDSLRLQSNTLKKILSKDAMEFKGIGSEDIVRYCDEQLRIKYMTPNNAKHWEHRDYFTRMLGGKFEIETTQLLYFLGVYTIPRTIVPDVDSNTKYLCIRCEMNLGEGVTMKYVLSEVKYVK